MGLSASIAALESGEVDAVFITGAVPDSALQSLEQRRDDVEKFLSLVVDSANELTREFYRVGFISTKTPQLDIAVPMHPGAARFYEKNSEKMRANRTD